MAIQPVILVFLHLCFAFMLGGVFARIAPQDSSSCLSKLRINLNKPKSASQASQTYVLQDMYQGDSFFEGWDFFTDTDPTHGLVNYISQGDADQKKLAFVQDNKTVVLAVDDTTTLKPGNKRDSIRIQSKKTYNGGIFIADFKAMPHGCSVWPAWWSVGPNWPSGGEIDIVEGVHDPVSNQYTLHTGDGCTLSTANIAPSAKQLGTQCATIDGDNTGCAFLDTDATSYGKAFNAAGGGVYAHKWDSNGISAWHFTRSAIPNDIASKEPNPNQWGEPAAFWSTASCDITSHFHDHNLVIDTTLCGDWAGATYGSAGCPGTCEDAVADPNNYKEAKWNINYIAVYQLKA